MRAATGHQFVRDVAGPFHVVCSDGEMTIDRNGRAGVSIACRRR